MTGDRGQDREAGRTAGGGTAADREPPAPAGAEATNGAAAIPAESAIVATESGPWGGTGWMFGGQPSAALPLGMATSEQIESFRELRTRLMLMAKSSGLTHFTTTVVPLTEDSGGSFVARNLAAAFTLQRRHALLIDCNFRNATQHEVLRPDVEIDGLFEFLGRMKPKPVDVPLWPTLIPGLHLIPAGRCEASPGGAHVEVLASKPMKQLMETVRGWPCYVVLDSPPFKGSPDARLLSDLADFVVLVVGSGRSTTQDIARAAAVFDRNKLAGVAFNEYSGAGASRRAR